MKFKVGDKVRLKDGGYYPRENTVYYNNREFAKIHGLKEEAVYEIADYNELNNVIVLKENYLCFSANRFKLVKPELQENKVVYALANAEKVLANLRQVEKKYKLAFTPTFNIVISDMAKDSADAIEELLKIITEGAK